MMSFRQIDPEKIWELAGRVADGELSPEDRRELAELLSSSSEARRLYLEYVCLHGELYWHLGLGSFRPSVAEELAETIHGSRFPTPTEAERPRVSADSHQAGKPFTWRFPRETLPHISRRRILRVVGAVAVVVIAAILVVVGAWVPRQITVEKERPVVAVVESWGAEWEVVTDYQAPFTPGNGPAVHEGSSLSVTQGAVHLALAGGKQAVVEGPARISFPRQDRLRLDEGVVSISCTGGTRSPVVVETPFAEIREIGTSFAVRAGEAGGEIHVFDGEIEVRLKPGLKADAVAEHADPPSPETGWLTGVLRRVFPMLWSGAPPCLSLSAGQAVRIEFTSGQAILRRVVADPGRFLRPPEGGAAVVHWRQAVRREPHLRHLWSFEGWNLADKLRDGRGHLALQEVVMFEGAGGGQMDYFQPGADPTGRAVAFHRAGDRGNSRGVALQTVEVFVPPETFTIQAIVRFDRPAIPREEDLCVLLGTRQGPSRCGFLVVADGWGRLGIILDAERPWLETPLRFTPGEWYFVAVVFCREDRDDTPGTVVDAYAAALGEPRQALTKILRGVWVPGWVASGQLGVGKGFEKNGAHAYPWPGAVDEIAIFDVALTEAQIERHFTALVGQ